MAQDYRYIGCEPLKGRTGSVSEKIIKCVEKYTGGEKEDKKRRRECITSERLEQFIEQDDLYRLRNEYSPMLEGEDLDLADDATSRVKFSRTFLSGEISMKGSVTFEIYPFPSEPDSIALTGHGAYLTQHSMGIWVMGEFSIPIRKYSIERVMTAGYLDVEIGLSTVPLLGPDTWDGLALARQLGAEKAWPAPREGEVRERPYFPASGGEKNSDAPVRYRIFIKRHPTIADVVEIDYDAGHIISTASQEPIGCMFLEDARGLKMIDFRDVTKIRKDYGPASAEPAAAKAALDPLYGSGRQLCPRLPGDGEKEAGAEGGQPDRCELLVSPAVEGDSIGEETESP
ncbi:MAG: hypothetical protein KC431_25380 [Myxococcales bacterium]|nr:hypothetical protein [Myxococcales bacterium]